MGLDVTAYKNLVPAPDAKLDEDGYPEDYDNFFTLWSSAVDFTEKNWPGRTEGIPSGKVFRFDDAFGFRAGSYGGYNQWRRMLAMMAHDKTDEEVWGSVHAGPFVELIHFADNEGVIGPVVAAKLAKDFADFEDKAQQWAGSVPDGGYFLEKYRDWRKAFELASDGGAVNFH